MKDGLIMNNNDLSFRRKERKYIILEHTFDEIVGELEQHIPVYHFENNPGLVNIETTYFDTDDFLLFKEFLIKRKFRFKIRMRRYGYNGVFQPEYLVEFKVSHSSISSKRRFVLPAQYYDAFVRNEDLRAEVKEANQGLVGAQKTYRIIRELFRINNLQPVLRTCYDRIAFQKQSKRVRVTVDNGIRHTRLLGKAKIETLDATVLESKIMGKTPKWHKRMVNSLSLLQQQRFSKYATGINSLYFPGRGKYNFYNEDELAKQEIPTRISESFELLKGVIKLEDSALHEV